LYEFAAALSCQRIAGFYRCFAGRYFLWVEICGDYVRHLHAFGRTSSGVHAED
jgi:hypothetical protein